jgi:hypothetical protein
MYFQRTADFSNLCSFWLVQKFELLYAGIPWNCLLRCVCPLHICSSNGYQDATYTTQTEGLLTQVQPLHHAPSGLEQRSQYFAFSERYELNLYIKCRLTATMKAFLSLVLFDGLLAVSQYHLDAVFPWFPSVFKEILRRFPRCQVVSACFFCNPPGLNVTELNPLL